MGKKCLYRHGHEVRQGKLGKKTLGEESERRNESRAESSGNSNLGATCSGDVATFRVSLGVSIHAHDSVALDELTRRSARSRHPTLSGRGRTP